MIAEIFTLLVGLKLRRLSNTPEVVSLFDTYTDAVQVKVMVSNAYRDKKFAVDQNT